MPTIVRLSDLAVMHPCLLWDDITAAAVAVMSDTGADAPFPLDVSVENVPGFGSETLSLALDSTGVSSGYVERARRTYERHRLVELAAIAIAGVGLSCAGGHMIRDVALRGSAADYLVDESNCVLEIAGRSRRSDFGVAWYEKWRRLTDRLHSGFYVCVIEFESPAGRLAFSP